MSTDVVKGRRGTFVAVAASATIAVVVASALGVVLSRLGCEGSLSGLHGDYCSESDQVGVGVGVTLGLLVPPLVTVLAAVLDARRRNYRVLLMVALAMSLVGLLFPWLLWQ